MDEHKVRVPFVEGDGVVRDTVVKVALHTLERAIMAEVAQHYRFSGRRVGKDFQMTATPKGE